MGTRALELRGGRVMEVAWLVQVMQLRGSLGIKPGSSDAAAAAFSWKSSVRPSDPSLWFLM